MTVSAGVCDFSYTPITGIKEATRDIILCHLTHSTLTDVLFKFLKIWPPVGHRVGHRVGHGLPHVLP